jgi:hypothetical protein
MNPGDPLHTFADAVVLLLDRGSPAVGPMGEAAVRVLVDEQGTVVGTVAGPGTTVRTAVVADADRTLGEFADSPAITLLVLDVPHLVLVRDGAVVGVVRTSVVADYLASGAHQPARNELGSSGASADGFLPGAVRIAVAHVACAQPDCGHVNAVEYWNPRTPPRCANPDRAPHDLVFKG